MKNYLLAITLFILLSACAKNDPIDFFKELSTYEVSEEIPFDPSWWEAEKKIVIAAKSLYFFSIPFIDLVEPYDFPVLIYVSADSPEQVLEYLKKHDFKHPIIFDPEANFFEKNRLRERFNFDKENTLTAFYMMNDEIIKPANIGMREWFVKELKEFEEL